MVRYRSQKQGWANDWGIKDSEVKVEVKVNTGLGNTD